MKTKVWLERRWNGAYVLWSKKPKEKNSLDRHHGNGLILFAPCEKLMKKYGGLKKHLKVETIVMGTMEFKFKR